MDGSCQSARGTPISTQLSGSLERAGEPRRPADSPWQVVEGEVSLVEEAEAAVDGNMGRGPLTRRSADFTGP
ncbi:hypothetical protein RB195_025909 [Necator americanus]|uniref:Uncharacterized protein n=1 Tax=Necator americanus TaxID=51031 RepID=A0ABR1EUP1_NECAM